MQYELLFSYNLEENYNVIFEHISKNTKSWKIICDNAVIVKKLKNKGLDANSWKGDTNEDYSYSKKIYNDAKKIQNEYLEIFKELKFRDIEIFKGFDYSLLMQIALLTKAKTFLEKKQKIIFIFSSFFDIYFAFNGFFKELGYSNNEKIGLIKNQKIEFLNLETYNATSKYKNEFSQKRIKRFSKSIANDKSLIKKLQNTFSLSSKLISYFGNYFLYKLFHSINKNQIDKILKNIGKKIPTDKKLNTIFFITTSRGDTYLKPWYSVFNKFNKENLGFLIITSDFSTSVLLSKEKIPFVSIFNEINIIQNEIKNNKIGIEIKNKIQNTISKNKHSLGLKEMSNYFIKQSLKSISIEILCEHIITKNKINSIVALADGEMLENISLQISKKYKISNFSMLPVIVPLHAILSDWFHADKIFVSGKKAMNSLLDLGYDEQKIIVTGNPLYDYTKNINLKESKIKLEKEFGIDSSKKLVVIATGEYHKDDEIWMSKLIKFCNNNNFEIIIKLHPKWKLSNSGLNTDQVESECKNQKYLILYDIDIKTLLSASDLIITDYSNIGLEAICLEKPLITINFEKEDLSNIIKYHEYEAALYFESYLELEKSISKIFNTGFYDDLLKMGRQKFTEQYNLGNDGNANKRIYEHLTKHNH